MQSFQKLTNTLDYLCIYKWKSKNYSPTQAQNSTRKLNRTYC